MSDPLKGAREALNRYSEAQLPKEHKPRRKNQKPEKITEKQVKIWLEKGGFSGHIVEAKGVFSQSQGRWTKGQTDKGFSDIVGCDPNGWAIFIELKAKGKRKNLSPHQYLFLKDKIERGAFAIVTDSDTYLESGYRH